MRRRTPPILGCMKSCNLACSSIDSWFATKRERELASTAAIHSYIFFPIIDVPRFMSLHIHYFCIYLSTSISRHFYCHCMCSYKVCTIVSSMQTNVWMWNIIKKEECYAIIKCKLRESSVQLEERVRLYAYGMYFFFVMVSWGCCVLLGK